MGGWVRQIVMSILYAGEVFALPPVLGPKSKDHTVSMLVYNKLTAVTQLLNSLKRSSSGNHLSFSAELLVCWTAAMCEVCLRIGFNTYPSTVGQMASHLTLEYFGIQRSSWWTQ